MLDDDPVKMVLDSDPIGTRGRGAQRARCIDQVEVDLRTTTDPSQPARLAACRHGSRGMETTYYLGQLEGKLVLSCSSIVLIFSDILNKEKNKFCKLG